MPGTVLKVLCIQALLSSSVHELHTATIIRIQQKKDMDRFKTSLLILQLEKSYKWSLDPGGGGGQVEFQSFALKPYHIET